MESISRVEFIWPSYPCSLKLYDNLASIFADLFWSYPIGLENLYSLFDIYKKEKRVLPFIISILMRDFLCYCDKSSDELSEPIYANLNYAFDWAVIFFPALYFI